MHYEDCVEVVRDDTRIARKNHRCSECNEIIKAGNPYQYKFYIYEDSKTSHRTCMDCISVRNLFFCEGFVFEQMWNDLEDYIFETNGQILCCDIRKLTPKATGRVFRMIEKRWKQLDEIEKEDEVAR